jgi:hypothetical protein
LEIHRLSTAWAATPKPSLNTDARQRSPVS